MAKYTTGGGIKILIFLLFYNTYLRFEEVYYIYYIYFKMYHAICAQCTYDVHISKVASQMATSKVVTHLDYTTLYSYQLKESDASLDFDSILNFLSVYVM